MIASHNVVAEKGKEATQSVANHRRTQVTHVHFLRHIGGGIVNDHDARLVTSRDSQTVIGGEVAKTRGQEFIAQGEIEKARSRHVDARQSRQIRVRHDFFGHLSRRATQALGDGHDAIGLIIRFV